MAFAFGCRRAFGPSPNHAANDFSPCLPPPLPPSPPHYSTDMVRPRTSGPSAGAFLLLVLASLSVSLSSAFVLQPLKQSQQQQQQQQQQSSSSRVSSSSTALQATQKPESSSSSSDSSVSRQGFFGGFLSAAAGTCVDDVLFTISFECLQGSPAGKFMSCTPLPVARPPSYSSSKMDSSNFLTFTFLRMYANEQACWPSALSPLP